MPGQVSQFDTEMMRRAIRLAMRGRGRVEPNPMVGCVLTRDNRVIGEACHEQFGGPHAEPLALSRSTDSPHGATAYVTLEPCCHSNKKTPPCVPALVAAKVARMAVGCVDPNPDVNGAGLDQLRAAGIHVDAGVLGDEAKQLLAPFIARTVYDRPYVTLKWAQTADGKVAGPGDRRTQISNPRSSQVIHELRGRCDAIMVGSNTVILDDPLLTPREVDIHRQPMRIVLDTRLRIPLESKLVRTARQTRTIVFFAADLVETLRGKIVALREAGVEPCMAEAGPQGLKLEPILIDLAGLGATHVIVDAGPTLAQSFFNQQILADRLWVIRSPMRIDDATAPASALVPPSFVQTGEIDLAGDRLSEWLNRSSPLFFAADPSADLHLAGSHWADSSIKNRPVV